MNASPASGITAQAKTVIDLEGRYLAPGFIDGHTHLESSMLDVGEYARAVVPHGTTAIVTDLHEIANVSGLAGIRYYLMQARNLPLELFLMAPSVSLPLIWKLPEQRSALKKLASFLAGLIVWDWAR